MQATSNLWALDFDGVLCDSVGESSRTAIRAATKLWPEVFDTDHARSKEATIVDGMRRVRPVVETGVAPVSIHAFLNSRRAAQFELSHIQVLPLVRCTQ